MKHKTRLLILLLVGSCSLLSLGATNTTAEITNYTFKIASCNGTRSACAWIGDRVVVMIEGETPLSRNKQYMDSVLTWLDNMEAKYIQLTGNSNLPIVAMYQNKPVIECVVDNCGAGGLANHGVLGMSTGIDLFNTMYNAAQNGQRLINQVFLYETNRNFYLTAYNNKFDWAMNNNAANWGWWTVGFNNANAVIITESLGLELYYFGLNRAAFRQSMIKQLEAYWSSPSYTFDNGWVTDRMPWDVNNSPNDLMSGLLIYSYENFGGDTFYKKLYQYMGDTGNTLIPNRADVFAFQECRDNMYKIWSLSANQDLANFFEVKMKWTISSACKTWVANKLQAPACSSPVIVSQPTGVTYCMDANADFRVIATGTNLTYQWQYFNGSNWLNAGNAGYNTNQLSTGGGSIGVPFRAEIFSNNDCPVFSNAVQKDIGLLPPKVH